MNGIVSVHMVASVVLVPAYVCVNSVDSVHVVVAFNRCA